MSPFPTLQTGPAHKREPHRRLRPARRRERGGPRDALQAHLRGGHRAGREDALIHLLLSLPARGGGAGGTGGGIR